MPETTRVHSLIIAAVAFVFTPQPSRAQQPTPPNECPTSTPTFRVGHTIQVLHVPGAPPSGATPPDWKPEDRPIQVHVWYPAREQDDCGDAGGLEPGLGGCQAPPAVYASRLHGDARVTQPPLQWSALAWTTGSSVAFENPRVAEGDLPFPVVVFSHGNGNDAFDYAYTLEALASHGYVVAAPDHLNNTQDDVRIDFVNKQAGSTVIPCLDGLPSPCARTDVPKSMADRFDDVEAVLDALPAWFGPRVDLGRAGIMGHSRGTVSSLSLAGGSTAWGFPKDDRIKAVMGLSIGAAAITQGVDLPNVTVPTLLVGGSLDRTGPVAVSQMALAAIGTPLDDKKLLVIPEAVHRHFDSAYCAQVQSSGAIAQGDTKALLDLQTLSQILHNPNAPLSGNATDFCAIDAFTTPTNIVDLVDSLYTTLTPPGFTVTPSDVPAHGLTTDMVKDQVVGLAVSFFGSVLGRADVGGRPFDCLPDDFENQPSVPDPTPQDLEEAALHADDPD